MKKSLFSLTTTIIILFTLISCVNTENELVVNDDGTYTCGAVTFELPSDWEVDDAQDENDEDTVDVAEFNRENGNFGNLNLSIISFDDMLERQNIYASGLNDERVTVSNYESKAVILENGSGFLDTFLISDDTGNGIDLAYTDLYIVLDDNKVCTFEWVELPANSVDDFSFFYDSIEISD